MKLRWIAALALVVAVLVTFLFVRHREPVEGPGDAPPQVQAADDSPAASAESVAPLRARAPSEPADPTADWLNAARHLQFIVQDEVGRPIEGASVRSMVMKDRRSASNYAQRVTTSAHGIADVPWPAETISRLDVTASKDGYSSRRMIWDLSTGDTIPPAYTIKLRAGVDISGLVVDEQSNGIAGATIRLSRYYRGSDEMVRKGEEAILPSTTNTSDANGRWIARGVPPEILNRLSFHANHSNYIAANSTVPDTEQAERDLKSGAFKLVLKQGMVVSGKVVNQQRQPLAGAKVWAGRKYYASRQQTKTDSEGRFSFKNVERGKVDITASADGYAPAAKNFATGPDAPEVEVVLEPGSTMSGIVQDETGQPIEKVRVSVEGSPGEDSYDHFEFSTETDADGKFVWKSAPSQPMPFYFGKTGYEQRRRVMLKAGEENVVKLRAEREVHGLVQDAQTGNPVTNFSVAVGNQTTVGGTSERFYSTSGRTKNFNSLDGTFKVSVGEERDNAVQVTAQGYADQVQELRSEDRSIEMVFRMQPSPALTGTVVSAQGEPVPNVAIGIAAGRGMPSLQFSRGKLTSYSSGKTTKSDSSGRFSIDSPPDSGTVLASCSTGYASATIAEVRSTGLLRLRPFGRIEGVVISALGSASGAEVLLRAPAETGVNFDFSSYKQTADEQGHFAFDNVPPGRISVVRLIKTNPKTWAHSHNVEVTVASGQTTQVILGGTDATLHGVVRMEEPIAGDDYTIIARLSSQFPKPPENLSPEERRAYYTSPEYKALMSSHKSYTAVVDRNGNLLLDSVVPGDYTLSVTAERENSSGSSPMPRQLASGQAKITVPAGASPASPIPIGEVILKKSANAAR